MPNAIVVGGSTGIGRGVADAWAAAGLDVTVYSRSRPVGPDADLLNWHRLDFRDSDAARLVIADTLPSTIDLACYSAIYYTARRDHFSHATEQDWLDQLKINLHGLWNSLQLMLPILRASKPAVFLSMSSEVVYNSGPARSGYAATKAAAASLIGSVSLEEDPQAVRLVQAMPAAMVDSPGIRARRPADFDYSAYMQPDDFAPFATDLAHTRGEGYAGDTIVVEEDRTWRSIRDGLPVSQSRPIPSDR